MFNSVVFENEALPQMEALQRYALKLCRDDQSAQDLVQETMLKAFRYSNSYTVGTNCKAWLFQICKNSYINSYRRAQHEPLGVDFQELEAHSTQERGERQSSVKEVALQDEGWALLENTLLGDEVTLALATIPEDYQTAIILSDIEGCSYEEIANFVQVPIGTIRSRIHRGRRMLADRLAKHALDFGYALEETKLKKGTVL